MPLFVTSLLALAVLVADGRPLFFRQPRVGAHQRPFTVWKLRTMTCEPDPSARRPTRFGQWLRLRGLDELAWAMPLRRPPGPSSASALRSTRSPWV